MSNDGELLRVEKKRNEVLKEIGNLLHESVPVDDNEDNNKVERTFGDCGTRKKYSHVDLICMIDGVDTERGTVVSGKRRSACQKHIFLVRYPLLNHSSNDNFLSSFAQDIWVFPIS